MHPGAALPLLRHGAGQPGLRDPRRGHGLSRARASIRWPMLQAVPRSAARRCTACRPCSSPSSTIRDFARVRPVARLRTGIMAGSPCPIEVMKRVVARDAHARGDHRLRHDRDQPGQLPERRPTIRSSGASSTVGRIQPHLEVKIVDADGPHRAARARRASCCTRGYSVMRATGTTRSSTRRGDRRRRLDAHRRPRRRSTPRATATSSAASRTW